VLLVWQWYNYVRFSKYTNHNERSNPKLVVYGIPSAPREIDIVSVHLEDLLQNDALKYSHILLLLSGETATQERKKKFEDMGIIVYTHPESYEVLEQENIPLTMGHTRERVIWRTRQVLDYVTLLNYTLQFDGEYILITEDDVKASKNFIQKSHHAAKEYFQQMVPVNGSYQPIRCVFFWAAPGPSAVAFLYHRDVVPSLINYLTRRCFDAPKDYLIEWWEKESLWKCKERKPNIVQHTGHRSSFSQNNMGGYLVSLTSVLKSSSFLVDEDNTTCLDLPYDDNNNKYIGCFKDDNSHPNKRDFQGVFTHEHHNPNTCRRFCYYYRFFGLQNHGCSCGNEFGYYGQVDERYCDVVCDGGDPTHHCGGIDFNSVYKV